ncbi:MAG: N-acetyltransferase [Lachnospiraceae bacterium]|nr:N-acetyltransferase [Lachnospiraceae bacterium]
MIRPAAASDKTELRRIFDSAKEFMDMTGNPDQWPKGSPYDDEIADEIERGRMHVLYDEDGTYGAFIVFDTPDPTYAVIEDGAWKHDGPYRTIHRVASDHTRRNVFGEIMAFASRDAEHIRMDTYKDNTVMQHVLEKFGFERRGIIHLQNGSPRIAYEWEKDTDA